MADPDWGVRLSDDATEQLAGSLRECIAALEEAPSLSPAEGRLLANFRATLAEWETGKARAELVREVAAWLRHADRLDEIVGAKVGLPEVNVLWEASFAIEREFGEEGQRSESEHG